VECASLPAKPRDGCGPTLWPGVETGAGLAVEPVRQANSRALRGRTRTRTRPAELKLFSNRWLAAFPYGFESRRPRQSTSTVAARRKGPRAFVRRVFRHLGGPPAFLIDERPWTWVHGQNTEKDTSSRAGLAVQPMGGSSPCLPANTSLRACCGSAPSAHRRAARQDAASTARLILRKRSAPAARASSLLRQETTRAAPGLGTEHASTVILSEAKDLLSSSGRNGGISPYRKTDPIPLHSLQMCVIGFWQANASWTRGVRPEYRLGSSTG